VIELHIDGKRTVIIEIAELLAIHENQETYGENAYQNAVTERTLRIAEVMNHIKNPAVTDEVLAAYAAIDDNQLLAAIGEHPSASKSTVESIRARAMTPSIWLTANDTLHNREWVTE
jgi:hypothetical protein